MHIIAADDLNAERNVTYTAFYISTTLDFSIREIEKPSPSWLTGRTVT